MKATFAGFFFVIGKGHYLYLEASSPRKHGDKSNILSPLMTGSQCMRFYYHMFGDTMGTLTVYMATNKSSPRALWIKSSDRGNTWHEANVQFNVVGNFQVIFSYKS